MRTVVPGEFPPWLLLCLGAEMLPGLVAGAPQPSDEFEGPFPSSLRATASSLIYLGPPLHCGGLVTTHGVLDQATIGSSTSGTY